jgi:imidazolonepropionase-like amidohydrolase
VPLLLGTDAGAYLVEPGYSVHDELEAMTEAGLSAAQALQTATTRPAQYLGLDGEWGAIRPGARADVVLLAGNPLQQVKNARTPLGIAVRGRWLDAAALNSMIERQAAANRMAIASSTDRLAVH